MREVFLQFSCESYIERNEINHNRDSSSRTIFILSYFFFISGIRELTQIISTAIDFL